MPRTRRYLRACGAHQLLAAARLAVLAGSLTCAQAQAPGDLRVALVIGNGAYPEPARLANPAQDARDMAATLRKFGFQVVEVQDGKRADIDAAIGRTRNILQGRQGLALLYYAGHGVQVDWRNYMVPVDARLTSAADVAAQAVPLNGVLDAFRAASTRMNIVVLDACRDNPFPASGASKGLAQLDAPTGTFLAFATAPGNVALDGEPGSAHSPYTGRLLQELEAPPAKIEDVFKRVRLAVRLQSKGRQIPWESTSLEEDFYFRTPGSAVQAPAPIDRDLEAWEDAKRANTAAAMAAYLAAYPSGHFSELAQARLDQLDKPVVRPQFRADDALANDTTTERFRLGDAFVYEVSGMLGEPNAPTRRRFDVTALHDDRVEMNQGGMVTDRLGNVQQRKERKWVDAQFFPAEYVVGRKWNLVAQIETQRGLETVTLQGRVVGKERLSVPAGSFDVFRVEIGGGTATGRQYHWTYWMNPRYGMPVKSVDLRRNERGRVVRNETHELVVMRAPR